jgi:hypothetical protein
VQLSPHGENSEAGLLRMTIKDVPVNSTQEGTPAKRIKAEEELASLDAAYALGGHELVALVLGEIEPDSLIEQHAQEFLKYVTEGIKCYSREVAEIVRSGIRTGALPKNKKTFLDIAEEAVSERFPEAHAQIILLGVEVGALTSSDVTEIYRRSIDEVLKKGDVSVAASILEYGARHSVLTREHSKIFFDVADKVAEKIADEEHQMHFCALPSLWESAVAAEIFTKEDSDVFLRHGYKILEEGWRNTLGAVVQFLDAGIGAGILSRENPGVFFQLAEYDVNKNGMIRINVLQRGIERGLLTKDDTEIFQKFAQDVRERSPECSANILELGITAGALQPQDVSKAFLELAEQAATTSDYYVYDVKRILLGAMRAEAITREETSQSFLKHVRNALNKGSSHMAKDILIAGRENEVFTRWEYFQTLPLFFVKTPLSHMRAVMADLFRGLISG